MEWRLGFRFYVFTYLSTQPTTSGGAIVLFLVFTGILFSVGPPWALSFVARRKIGEKGVSRGSKAALWILVFLYGGSEGRRADSVRIRPGAINAI